MSSLPDTLRTQALSSCRHLVAGLAGDSGAISRPQLESLFESGEFASCLFRLFDHGSVGCLYADEVAATVKNNLKE